MFDVFDSVIIDVVVEIFGVARPVNRLQVGLDVVDFGLYDVLQFWHENDLRIDSLQVSKDHDTGELKQSTIELFIQSRCKIIAVTDTRRSSHDKI